MRSSSSGGGLIHFYLFIYFGSGYKSTSHYFTSLHKCYSTALAHHLSLSLSFNFFFSSFFSGEEREKEREERESEGECRGRKLKLFSPRNSSLSLSFSLYDTRFLSLSSFSTPPLSLSRAVASLSHPSSQISWRETLIGSEEPSLSPRL